MSMVARPCRRELGDPPLAVKPNQLGMTAVPTFQILCNTLTSGLASVNALVTGPLANLRAGNGIPEAGQASALALEVHPRNAPDDRR